MPTKTSMKKSPAPRTTRSKAAATKAAATATAAAVDQAAQLSTPEKVGKEPTAAEAATTKTSNNSGGSGGTKGTARESPNGTARFQAADGNWYVQVEAEEDPESTEAQDLLPQFEEAKHVGRTTESRTTSDRPVSPGTTPGSQRRVTWSVDSPM